MNWRIILLLACCACTSDEERAQQRSARRSSRDSVMSGEVVQSAKTPTSVGRIIYEPPAALSYDSLRLKRPDLVRAADRRRP